MGILQKYLNQKGFEVSTSVKIINYSLNASRKRADLEDPLIENLEVDLGNPVFQASTDLYKAVYTINQSELFPTDFKIAKRASPQRVAGDLPGDFPELSDKFTMTTDVRQAFLDFIQPSLLPFLEKNWRRVFSIEVRSTAIKTEVTIMWEKSPTTLLGIFEVLEIWKNE